MKSIKVFWKTRAYPRIFINNIGNQVFLPEIKYYKIESRKKKGEEKSFPFITDYGTSKTYINRSFVGTVNACDPIISTGLSESILKSKQTKKCCLKKGQRRTQIEKKKSLCRFRTFTFYFPWRAKFHAEF